MPAPTHPSNLQRRIHAGGGRVLEQRKSTGVRIHTTRRRWGPTGSQLGRPTDVHTATTTHLNFVQV